jgi:amino acid transporter
VHALPDLARVDTPLVAAAHVYGGEWAAKLVSAGQIVSALGIAFGQYAVTPRYLSALGRNDAIGAWIGAEDTRRVPQRALWITAAAVLCLVMREELMTLFSLASIAVLAQYALATIALGVLAWRGHHGVQRREIAWALPALVGVGLVAAAGAEQKELWSTAAVTALGALLLAVTQRARQKPASAP